MKTLNGAPQFEGYEYRDQDADLFERESINEQLREWAESRRCVNCANYKHPGETGFRDRCSKLDLYYRTIPPELFSCALFSPGTTANGDEK